MSNTWSEYTLTLAKISIDKSFGFNVMMQTLHLDPNEHMPVYTLQKHIITHQFVLK